MNGQCEAGSIQGRCVRCTNEMIIRLNFDLVGAERCLERGELNGLCIAQYRFHGQRVQ